MFVIPGRNFLYFRSECRRHEPVSLEAIYIYSNRFYRQTLRKWLCAHSSLIHVYSFFGFKDLCLVMGHVSIDLAKVGLILVCWRSIRVLYICSLTARALLQASMYCLIINFLA